MKALSYDNCLTDLYRLNAQQQSTTLYYFLVALGIHGRFSGGFSHAQITEAFNRARIKALVIVPSEVLT